MSPSFKAAVEKALNKPIIIADRFHFCRYIYWAMDGVRRRVQSTWEDYDRKKCKRMRHIFYKSSGKLNHHQRWRLSRYCCISTELKEAYHLKEAFCKWFKQAKQNGAENIRQTKEDLSRFYKMVEESGIPEFKKSIQTLKNWQVEVLNSFVYGLTP